jgi:uncharacterized membrane protein
VNPSRGALLGLLVLSAWLVAAPPAGATASAGARLLIGLLCAAPLLLLVAAGLRAVRQWGAWVAITMIPYFTLSVGSMLVAPGQRVEGAAFASLIVIVFFTGIAALRQRP